MQASVETARRSRREIERVRLLLMQPGPNVLELCAQHVQKAAQHMGALEAALGRGASLAAREALQRELSDLRRDLSRVRALLDNAAHLYASWAALMGRDPDSPNSYGPDGSSSVQTVVRKLVVHG